jgi:hypothetical protein
MNATNDQPPRPAGLAGHLKNVALFFAAPFITLSYAAALPFAAVRLLRRGGAQAGAADPQARR